MEPAILPSSLSFPFISVNRFPHLLAVALVLALITGCTTIADQRQSLASSTSCCESFKDMRFEPAPTKTWQKFEIQPSTKVFLFAEGKSYFQAFALGESLIRQVIFRVHPQGAANYNPSIFCPNAVFLDQEFIQLSTVDIPLQFVAAGWTTNAYLAGRMEVPASARYLVIRTTEAQQGGNVSILLRREGFAYSTGTSAVVVPGRGYQKVELPCAPMGSFDMWVQPMPK